MVIISPHLVIPPDECVDTIENNSIHSETFFHLAHFPLSHKATMYLPLIQLLIKDYSACARLARQLTLACLKRVETVDADTPDNIVCVSAGLRLLMISI